MIGGGSRSDLWCQIHADVLNRKILQIEEPKLARLRGAAFLGAVAMGYVKFENISQFVSIRKEYTPSREESDLYTQSFREFVALYESNKDIYQRLNSSY